MIKAKFGDFVRPKTDVAMRVAMRNEATVKILCNNLCCLIQSTYELWIVATFWKRDEPTPEPAQKVIDVTPITKDEAVDAYV